MLTLIGVDHIDRARAGRNLTPETSVYQINKIKNIHNNTLMSLNAQV
jgi:hypothetical protein